MVPRQSQSKANLKPICRSRWPPVPGRRAQRLYVKCALARRSSPAPARKLNFAERTQSGRLLHVLGIGVEEGLERQNARVILEAIGVGALDRDLEQDMRDALHTLSKAQDRRGLQQRRLLARPEALARPDLVGVGPTTRG